MRRRAQAAAATATLLVLSALAWPAAAEGFDLNNAPRAPGAAALQVTHPSQTLRAGSFGFDLGGNLVFEPLVSVGDDDERTVLVDRAAFLQFAARLGLPGPVPLELQLRMPVGLAIDGVHPDSGATLPTGAAGDPTFALKSLLWGDAERGGVFVYPWLAVPAGGDEALVGESQLSVGLLAGYEALRGPLRWGANLGYRRRGQVELGASEVGDRVSYSAGAQLDTLGDDLLLLGAEVYGAVGVTSDISASELPLELNLGGSLRTGPSCRLGVGYGLGVVKGIGAGTSRLLASLTCVGEPKTGTYCGERDTDSDGLDDCCDRCPEQPEDRDGVADLDGCPEQDADGDGLADPEDMCPLRAEDRDGLQDADGCPEAGEDTDGDGILDTKDGCPDTPEDRDGFQDEDGCPEPDNDNDGIPDTSDRCPNVAEDRDGFQDEDGCPDDNDGDGIPDATDRCPAKPETFNGVEDHDGCPDGEELVVQHEEKLEIREVVHFELDSAEVQQRSHALLDTVATVVLKHTDWKAVRIEGHTDDQGDDDSNLRLSKARAESVKRHLVGRGVPAERLLAEGHGESRPVVPVAALEPNSQELRQARARNRRVEFYIVR